MIEKTHTDSDDITNWDWLIQHCDTISGLTPIEIENAKRALVFLKEELGEDFLATALEKKHPLMFGIINMVPWTRKQFIWFAEALKAVRKQKNYDTFINRIKNADKYKEAVSVLTDAYIFHKAGFSIQLDPMAGENVPDLKIVNPKTNEELFVEISMQEESQAKSEAFKIMLAIQNAILSSIPFVYWCGRVHKILAPSHLKEIIGKVQAMLRAVQESDKFQELNITGVIELAIAPEGDKSLLQKWTDDRQLKIGSFEGPPYDANEVVRVRRKIEKEQKQLPTTQSNIVVIQNNDVFHYVQDVRDLIGALEEEVYKYKHVLITIVSGGHIGTGKTFNTMKDQHVYFEVLRFGIIVDKHILLLNRFCDFKISPATITKLYTAFMEY